MVPFPAPLALPATLAAPPLPSHTFGWTVPQLDPHARPLYNASFPFPYLPPAALPVYPLPSLIAQPCYRLIIHEFPAFPQLPPYALTLPYGPLPAFPTPHLPQRLPDYSALIYLLPCLYPLPSCSGSQRVWVLLLPGNTLCSFPHGSYAIATTLYTLPSLYLVIDWIPLALYMARILVLVCVRYDFPSG